MSSGSPEQQARVAIDKFLAAAGWVIQDLDELNLSGGQGGAGTNPVIQTNKYRAQSTLSVGIFLLGNTVTSPRAG